MMTWTLMVALAGAQELPPVDPAVGEPPPAEVSAWTPPPSREERRAAAVVRGGKAMFITGASMMGGAALAAGGIGISMAAGNCSGHCFGEFAGLTGSIIVGSTGALVAIIGGSVWGAGAAQERRLEGVTLQPVVRPMFGPGSVGLVGRF